MTDIFVVKVNNGTLVQFETFGEAEEYIFGKCPWAIPTRLSDTVVVYHKNPGQSPAYTITKINI